jgi:triacylglycerol esterase/lipase EstA (alpha/beta hydrolase family)
MKTMRRLSLGSSLLGISLAILLGSPAFIAEKANAASSSQTPVLLIHGYESTNFTGIDCATGDMDKWKKGLMANGFLTVKTIGFYKKNKNCDLNVPGRANNLYSTDLAEIARELSNLIQTTYGATPVAISAHSMGGLIVRRMIMGVQNGEAGFSPSIKVRDAVTSGTPHNGAISAWLDLCDFQTAYQGLQCKQMRKDSQFLKGLASAPQTIGGTDWTVFGGFCDIVVSVNSATSMSGSSVGVGRFDPEGLCAPGQGGYDHQDLIRAPVALQHIANAIRTDD